jgi:hypothetical protein
MCFNFIKLNKFMRRIWCGAGVLPHERIKPHVAFMHITGTCWISFLIFLVIGSIVLDQMYATFLSTSFVNTKCDLVSYTQYSSPYCLPDSGFERGYCVHLFNVTYAVKGKIENSVVSELTFGCCDFYFYFFFTLSYVEAVYVLITLEILHPGQHMILIFCLIYLLLHQIFLLIQIRLINLIHIHHTPPHLLLHHFHHFFHFIFFLIIIIILTLFTIFSIIK